MKKAMFRYILTTLFLLAYGPVTAFVLRDSISANPPFLLKVGGYISGQSVPGNYLAYSLNAGLEIPLGAKFSLAPAVRLYSGQTAIDAASEAALDLRFYPNDLKVKGQPVSYAGLYLALSAYLNERKLLSEGNYDEATAVSLVNEISTSGQYIRPLGGVGIKVGKQVSGFLDFGVFAGAEKAGEVNNSGYWPVYYNHRIYPEVHSYFLLSLPLAVKGENFYRNMKLFSVSPYTRKTLLKLGLQDVFSFSAKGLYFNPSVAYEVGLVNTFSVNIKGKLNFQRRSRYEDLSSVAGIPLVDQAPFLIQHVGFQSVLQPRFYIPGISGAEKMNLKGLYAFTELAVLAASIEYKKKYWEYEKQNELAFGYGLGYQQRLYNNILIDLSAGLRTGITESFSKHRLMVGMDISWAK